MATEKKKSKKNIVIEGTVKPYCDNEDHGKRHILGNGECMTRDEARILIQEHRKATGHTETNYLTC
jgi:hypothetical protein